MLPVTAAIVAVGVRCRVKCRAAEEATVAVEDEVEEEAAFLPVPKRAAAQLCFTMR